MSNLTKENTAFETASHLLIDAIQETHGFVPLHIEAAPGSAIIVAAHALIAKLDSMETSLLDAVGDLRESLDYLAASDDAELTPCKHESEVIYRALEADFLANNTPASIEKMDAALCRFKKLAGY